MAKVAYPWERPDAPDHVKRRQTVWNMTGPSIRIDLPRRRPPFEYPRALQGLSYGCVVMTHNGFSNGRLSILLSSLPENLPTIVSSDAIDPGEWDLDRAVAEYHGARFHHHAPWDGRAGHAIGCMAISEWEYTLLLMDDVWLAPEVTIEAFRWTRILQEQGIPLAALAVSGWELYHHWKDFGFSSWQDTLDHPERLEAVPPNPAFFRAPCLYKNPFGACWLMVREAYDALGGFSPLYWANDDVFHHKVWTSGKWVNAAMPGRGYCHYGAQSNHFGETQEWVGTFEAATGMTAGESGALQYEYMKRWAEKLGPIFLRLGGTAMV